MTKPLFFLSSRAAEEVKSGGQIMGGFGGTLFLTRRFSSWLLSPTLLRPSSLILQGVHSPGQLDADGILWVPHPLPSQHRWQQEYLWGTVAKQKTTVKQTIKSDVPFMNYSLMLKSLTNIRS